MTPRNQSAALALAAVLLATGWGGAPAQAAPGLRGPGYSAAWRAPLPAVTRAAHPVPPSQRPTGAGAVLLQGLLGFYQRVISPVDGDRCSMAPTCSLYSRQALARHGVVLGVILTADRLLHEADEIPFVSRIRAAGETYFVDPLVANTYWLPLWLQ